LKCGEEFDNSSYAIRYTRLSQIAYHRTMKRIPILLLLFFLVSCVRGEVAQAPVVANTKLIPPTSTSFPPTSLPSDTPPVPTIAPTEIPCDPFSVDFCINEGYFILQRPIHPPANDLVEAGYRYGSTANGKLEPHHGVEFPNPSETPVYAAADGIVIFAGSDHEAIFSPWKNFYGNLVVIEHDGALFTLYAHLSKINISADQKVLVGDQIGEVGRTGVAIGSHLHFEVRRGNGEDYFATQSPELWLSPAKDVNGNPFGTLMISVVDENRVLVKHAEATINFYPDRSQPPSNSYFMTTYSPDIMNGEENMVLGELPAGHYRIALKRNNQLYERWVDVEWGMLTKVVIVVK